MPHLQTAAALEPLLASVPVQSAAAAVQALVGFVAVVLPAQSYALRILREQLGAAAVGKASTAVAGSVPATVIFAVPGWTSAVGSNCRTIPVRGMQLAPAEAIRQRGEFRHCHLRDYLACLLGH